MRVFKDLYIIICYALLAAQLGFICILVYNKLVYHRQLYYGDDKDPAEVSANYFYVLKTLLYSTFALVIAWAIFTPLAVLANKRTTLESDRIGLSKGIVGFIIAVILLITDPFGMLAWFSNAV